MTTKRDALAVFTKAMRSTFPDLDEPAASAAFIRTKRGAELYRAYANADPDPAAEVAKELRPDQILADDLDRRTREYAKAHGFDYITSFARLRQVDPVFKAVFEAARRAQARKGTGRRTDHGAAKAQLADRRSPASRSRAAADAAIA